MFFPYNFFPNNIGTGASKPRRYLPGTPFFVGSPTRLVQGYNGNVVQLRRVTDSVTQTFGFKDGSNYLDSEAIAAWAGSSVIEIMEIYDQAGSARKLDAAVIGRPPHLNLNGPGGRPTFCAGLDIASQTNNRGWVMNGISYERSNMSMFYALRPSLQVNCSLFELVTGTTRDLGIIGSSTGGLTVGSAFATNVYIPCQNTVISVSSSTSGIITRINDQDISTAAVTAKASTGIRFQIGVSDPTKYMAVNYDAIVFYSDPRTSDRIEIHNILKEIFLDHPPASKRLVIDGDSIMSGYGSDFGQNPAYFAEQLLTTPVDICNRSGYGYRYITSLAPNVATRVGNVCQSGDVVVVVAGGNDMLNAATPSACWTAIQTYMTNLRAAKSGLKIVIGTLIPRNSGNSENGSTGTQALNTLIRDGWSTTLGCQGMIDFAIDSQLLANMTDTTVWMKDDTHWRERGSQRIGEMIASAVNPLLV